MGGVAVVLGAVAVCLGAAAWRLHALPADQAHRLLRALGAEHEAMWASVWGSLPEAAQVSPAVSHEALGWSLWPRPQIHLDGVRWAVPAEVSGDGPLRLERLSLGLDWRSLWAGAPRLYDVRVTGLQGGSRHVPWGVQGTWRVAQARLGPPDAAGARALSWTLDARLHSLNALQDTPWLDGQWTGQAQWHPLRDGEPAHWRQVDMRFQGQLAGQLVPSARLTLARWLHQGSAQRLAWDDLVLQAQLGEAAQASQIELRSPRLQLGPDSASGQPLQGHWHTGAPPSLSWQMASGAPRGRYADVTWPQWRVVPSGRDGSRAGGQLQADLGWLLARRALRWDALVGEVSVQPRGEAERQWSLRGQIELGLLASSWQLEGQAQGGAPDGVLWDGPFATEGTWRRWPVVQSDARLRVAALWADRWRGASSAARWPDRLQLHVGQLGWKGVRLSGAEAQLTHQDGVLRVPALQARLWDGEFQASGEWHLADGRWQLTARSREADLAQLRQTLDPPPPGAAPTAPRVDGAAHGRWSGTLALTGRRDDVREWQGRWSLEARAGHWPGLDLRAARQAASVATATDRSAHPAERTEWRRLQGAGTVAGGVAHIDRFQLQSAGWRAAADGSLDLQDGVLALDWSDLIGSRKRGPVLSVTGPWRAPTLRLP